MSRRAISVIGPEQFSAVKVSDTSIKYTARKKELLKA